MSTGPSTPGTTTGAEFRTRIGAFLVMALLFAAVVPWRPKSFFSGQLDPVVVLKAVITVIALGVAAVLKRRIPHTRKVPLTPVAALVIYLVICLLGAFLEKTTLIPSLVIVVRVALVAWAITLIVTAYGVPVVTASLIRVLQVAVAAGVVTRIGTLVAGGALGALGSQRLQGSFPPLNPNELAHLAAACLLWSTSRVLRAEETAADYLAILWYLGIVYLTGSRTTLLAVLVGIGAMFLRTRKLSVPGYVVTIMSLPTVAYVVLGTDIIASVLGRGGSQSIGTLSNRTIAWEAAFTNPATWNERVFGQGLSVKMIPVKGQWWDTQILDSSWISALVQSGYSGLVVLALWCLVLLFVALRTGHPWASFWLGLCVYLVAHSSLESGLFDASTAFLMFWVLNLACWSYRVEQRQPLDPTDDVAAPAVLADH